MMIRLALTILTLSFTAISHAQPVSAGKTPKVIPSWEDPSNKIKDAKKWTIMARDIVGNLTDLVDSDPKDMTDFCPSYKAMNRGEKINFWVALTSAMYAREASFNRKTRMREPCRPTEGNLCLDKVTGKEMVWSEGPFQLSYQDLPRYPACNDYISYELDRELFEKEMNEYEANLAGKQAEVDAAQKTQYQMEAIAPGSATTKFAGLLKTNAVKAKNRAFTSGLKTSYTDRTIHDLRNNMTCALKIMSSGIKKRGKIDFGYWSVLQKGRTPSMRDEIITELKGYGACHYQAKTEYFGTSRWWRPVRNKKPESLSTLGFI